MKVLSIIVPMYNTEFYIERCLDSFLYNEEIINKLEIIVVNDGGSDGSLEIVKKYKKNYPQSIILIDKENGGHGSTINAGIKIATGKYLRIVDSDDWVDIDNFNEYINRLKNEIADVVVTNVRRQQLYDESEIDFIFGHETNKPIAIEKVANKIMADDFFFEFSMHSMTVKTETLKAVWGEGLLEKTFYVDQQFVAKVFMSAKNYIEYNLNIYMYFIGRPEQSMGAGFFKHIEDHERVLKWLLNTTESNNLPNYYKVIVARQIELMLRTHYLAYVEQNSLTKKDKNDLRSFNNYLISEYPEYYKESGINSIYKKLSKSNNNKLIKAIKYYKGKNK